MERVFLVGVRLFREGEGQASPASLLKVKWQTNMQLENNRTVNFLNG